MFRVFDCGRTRWRHAGRRQRAAEATTDAPYLHCEGLQVGEPASRGKPQQLVPREVELPQGGEGHREAVEIIVAQIQDLYVREQRINVVFAATGPVLRVPPQYLQSYG